MSTPDPIGLPPGPGGPPSGGGPGGPDGGGPGGPDGGGPDGGGPGGPGGGGPGGPDGGGPDGGVPGGGVPGGGVPGGGVPGGGVPGGGVPGGGVPDGGVPDGGVPDGGVPGGGLPENLSPDEQEDGLQFFEDEQQFFQDEFQDELQLLQDGTLFSSGSVPDDATSLLGLDEFHTVPVSGGGFAIETRAEAMKVLTVGDAVRRGDLDNVQIGNAAITDMVTGEEKAEISGMLRERTGGNLTYIASRCETTIDGRMSITSGLEDNIILGGAMEDTWTGGTMIAAAMSDDLCVGVGARVTAPFDMWLNQLTGMEERPGTAAADGIFMELYKTLFEREYGPSVHAAGSAVFNGMTFQSQKTGFRQMMKLASGARNLIPGSGGPAAESPPPTPPAGAAAGAGGAVAGGGMVAGSVAVAGAGMGRGIVSTGFSVDGMSDAIRMGDAAADMRNAADMRHAADTATQIEDLRVAALQGVDLDDLHRTDIAGAGAGSAAQVEDLQTASRQGAGFGDLGDLQRTDVAGANIGDLGDLQRTDVAGANVKPSFDSDPRVKDIQAKWSQKVDTDVALRNMVENYDELVESGHPVGKHLTLEEFCALSFYTQARDAYTQINGARRAKNAAEVDPTWFAMGQAMEQGLKKLQDAGLAYSGKSFRGLPAQYISEAVEGGTLMDSAFLSTSTEWSVAEDFAMRSDGQAALEYIFGQSGMSLQDISMVGHENEILFSPSQELTVLLRHEPAPASKWDVPIVKLVLSDNSMPMNYGTTGVADAMLDFRPTGGTSGYGRTSSGIDALDLAGGVNRVGSFDPDILGFQYLELGSDWRRGLEIEPGQAMGLGEEAAGVSRHLEIETSGSRQLGNEPGAGAGMGVGRHLEIDTTGSRQLDFGPGPSLQNLGAPPVVDDAAQTGQFRLVGDYEDVQGVFRFDGVVEELPGQQYATRVDVQDLDVAVGELPVQQFAVRVDADAVIDAMPDTLRTADSPAGSELSRLHESAPVVEDVASPGAAAGLDADVFRAEVEPPGASHADGGVELRGGEYPANRETINGQLGEGDYVRVPDEQPEGLSPRVVPEDTPTVVSYTDPGDAYIGRRVDAGESESRRHARGRMGEAGDLARAEWNTANPDAPRYASVPQRDGAIQAAQIAEANKAWADIPAARSSTGNSGGGRQVRFGDARAITFKIEPEIDGSTLRVAADPVDTLDRSQEIRVDYFVQEPNKQWQPTRQPGFGRTASAPGEFPFSTREQLLNSLMKGESVRDSSEVFALKTEFPRAMGANFSGQSKSDWRKMAMLLRDLQVTQPGDAVRVSQFADSLGRAGYNAADAAAFLVRSQSEQATAFTRNLDWKSLGKMLAIFESGASVT